MWAGVTCTLGRKGTLQVVFHTTLDSVEFTDCDQVVYSCFLPTTIVRDMTLPTGSKNKDFPTIIEYQFIRTLPWDATDSKYWEYVQLSRKQKRCPVSNPRGSRVTYGLSGTAGNVESEKELKSIVLF